MGLSFPSKTFVFFFLRVLGGLIAAHLFIVDPNQPLGNLKPTDYDDDLLNLAHDLISRLLPAFSHTKTGVPWPRVIVNAFLS